MSICSTDDSLSDIAEFAAWDEAHPLPEGELHELSRGQSLIDMARSDRVWEGEDSSNDARDGEEDAVATVVKRGGKRKVVLSSTQTTHTTPSDGENQRSLRSSSRMLRSRKIEITTHVVVVQEKGLSQDLQGRKLGEGSDADAPPSSQPRHESEDEFIADIAVSEAMAFLSDKDEDKKSAVQEEIMEVTEEDEEKKSAVQEESAEVTEDEDKEYVVQEDDAMEIDTGFRKETKDEDCKTEPPVLVESEYDILDNVDIAPEEQGSPEDVSPQTLPQEPGMLQQARDGDDYNGTRRLSTFTAEVEFVEYLKNSIHLFATEHPFWIIDVWEDDDMAEFEMDIQQFAIAAGMDKEMADVEVVKAVEEWKSTRVKDTMDIDFIVNSSPAMTTTIPAVAPGSDKKRKREASKELTAIPELQIVHAGGDDKGSAKKRRKEDKKARHREIKGQKAIEKAATVLVGEQKEPIEVNKQQKVSVGNGENGQQQNAPGKGDESGQQQKVKCQGVGKEKSKTVEQVVVEQAIVEQPSNDKAAAEARRHRNIAKKLRRKQEKLSRKGDIAEAADLEKEQKRLAKKVKKQRKLEAEDGGNEKLNLQSSNDWYGAAPTNDATAAAANTSGQTPVTGLTGEAAAAQPLNKKRRKAMRDKKPTAEQTAVRKKSSDELTAKINMAKSAVKEAIETAPSKADNKKAGEENESKKRKKKRNKNKLPEQKDVKPTAPATPKPLLAHVATSSAILADGAPSVKRQRKRKEAVSKVNDEPLAKELAGSDQLVVKISVEAKKPVSKKRSRTQTEASEAVEVSTTDGAIESDEPRQKRQRTRKTKADYQMEKAVIAQPAAKVIPKSAEQEDVPMVDATEALAEIVDTNVKKRKRVRKDRKSMEMKEIFPQSEKLKVHHL